MKCVSAALNGHILTTFLISQVKLPMQLELLVDRFIRIEIIGIGVVMAVIGFCR